MAKWLLYAFGGIVAVVVIIFTTIAVVLLWYAAPEGILRDGIFFIPVVLVGIGIGLWKAIPVFITKIKKNR